MRKKWWGRIENSDKEMQHCDNYNMDGHSQENYFKIYGYPDWTRV